MAARANLAVADELKTAFTAAQDDLGLRWVQVGIDEEVVQQTGTGAVVGAAGADFDALAATVDPAAAAFYLFCLDDEGAAQSSRRWLLVSWVPDLCKVRDKMLFSSSREDLKRTLGAGYFVGEYYANEAPDLNWATYQRTLDVTEAPLSEREKILKEELVLERDTSLKSNAMGVIPFALTGEAQTAVEQFVVGVDGLNVLELRLGGSEEVDVASSHALDAEGMAHVGGVISADEPRFVVVRMGKTAEQVSGEAGGLFKPTTTTFFVYSCPDVAALRLKMTYSTAKATVIGAATALGLAFDKMVEVADAADLDAALAAEMNQGAAEPTALQHAATTQKPKRPGRGRARPQKKFVPDG